MLYNTNCYINNTNNNVLILESAEIVNKIIGKYAMIKYIRINVINKLVVGTCRYLYIFIVYNIIIVINKVILYAINDNSMCVLNINIVYNIIVHVFTNIYYYFKK